MWSTTAPGEGATKACSAEIHRTEEEKEEEEKEGKEEEEVKSVNSEKATEE